MISSVKNKSTSIGLLLHALTALCAVGTLLVLVMLLKHTAYGIDFTDEGFYLVWMSNPSNYDWGLSQFGFIYHPLYTLLSGNIAALRQANILITFVLAWVLAYFFLCSLANEIKNSRVVLLTAAAGLATTALIYFGSWLLTPSYNSLNLQALLISAIGLVLAEKSSHRTSIIGWLLIGVGGWLTFMAKPSTSPALVVGVFIYLLLSRKFSIRLILLAAACSFVLLIASALLIDGSIARFIERIQLGIEIANLQGSGHSLSEILRFDFRRPNETFMIVFALVFGTVFITLRSMWEQNKRWVLFGLLISTAFFALTASLALGQMHLTTDFGEAQGALVFSLVFAVIIVALLFGRLSILAKVTAPQWAIACLFLVMPYIYAFGANNNYWHVSSAVACFWLFAGLVLIGPLVRERASWALLLPIAIAAQAITAILLQTWFETPFRQPLPLRLNTTTLEIGPQRSPLILSEDYAEYITNAVSATRKADFEPTTPVIDLSGQSPGLLYAMGAENVGQAWIIGGYRGSLKVAEVALGRVSCEKLAISWVLFEKDGPCRVPTELISSFGADFPTGYSRVGTWQIAKGAGGYENRLNQELYKPIKMQETLTACEALRAKNIQ